MTLSAGFVDHCVELLSALGPTRTGRMFSGRGFYVDDVFIALAIRDRLYLKIDAVTRPRFEAAGCEPFRYETHAGLQVSIRYWGAPDEAMESPELMRPWARLAMEAALRARNAKPKPKPKAKIKPKAPAKKTRKLSSVPAPSPAKPKRAAKTKR